MDTFILVTFFFFIYAFLGWIVEFLYSLIVLKRVVDPGFLRLPFVPIYGITSVIIVYGIAPYVTNPFLVFIVSALAATIIEYIAHLLLEKLFHVQLWNYDHKKFNFQGRIALEMSLGFGVLALDRKSVV